MQIRGKVISISGKVAEVCIIKENTACGSCSACPKKMGMHDVIKVAATERVQVGQEVILCDTRNWLFRNKIVFSVLAFVSGIIVAEFMSMVISFGSRHKEIDVLAGGLAMIIMVIIVWLKRPRYLFRMELREGGRRKL